MNIEFDNIFQLNTDNQDVELDTNDFDFSISDNDNNKQIDLDTSTTVNVNKTSDHNKLINRDMENQHPIEAITSLTEELLSRPDTEIPDSFINTL